MRKGENKRGMQRGECDGHGRTSELKLASLLVLGRRRLLLLRFLVWQSKERAAYQQVGPCQKTSPMRRPGLARRCGGCVVFRLF